MTLTFTVVGAAQTKGSYRAYTYARPAALGGGIGARATNDNPKTLSWEQQIAWEARLAMRQQRINPDLFVDVWTGWHLQIEFFLPRPKRLRSYRGPHIKKPDLDKCVRAVMDALTDLVWVDDAQVTCLVVGKAYVAVGEPPRVVITVSPEDPAPLSSTDPVAQQPV